MITREQAEEIKEILGGHYTSLVQDQLVKMEATNKNGVVHTANQIRVVFAGNTNRTIEEAIFKAVEYQIEENKKREALLNKKSAAVTADS